MIEDFKDYEDLFSEIGRSAKLKINIYVIGGAVLLFRDLKPATKDIDIVVDSRKEYDELERVLKSIGFKIAGNVYDKFNIQNIFLREKMQIDLFLKHVCSKFAFSKDMARRAEKVLSIGNADVFLSSNEDVFAFKTMTERPGDIDDCIALAKRGLDWDIILQEIKKQAKGVWITWINERLELLEEKGVVVPILKETRRLTKEHYDATL